MQQTKKVESRHRAFCRGSLPRPFRQKSQKASQQVVHGDSLLFRRISRLITDESKRLLPSLQEYAQPMLADMRLGRLVLSLKLSEGSGSSDRSSFFQDSQGAMIIDLCVEPGEAISKPSAVSDEELVALIIDTLGIYQTLSRIKQGLSLSPALEPI